MRENSCSNKLLMQCLQYPSVYRNIRPIAIICICILCNIRKIRQYFRKSLSYLKFLRLQLLVIFLYTVSLVAACPHPASASPKIDLQAIAAIESSGRTNAVNPSDNGGIGSYGLYQLSPYVVEDFNRFHKTSYDARIHALEPRLATIIADWYLHKAIPSYLRHFKKPVTLANVLTAYNMGIVAVIRGQVATRYIAKYKEAL